MRKAFDGPAFKRRCWCYLWYRCAAVLATMQFLDLLNQGATLRALRSTSEVTFVVATHSLIAVLTWNRSCSMLQQPVALPASRLRAKLSKASAAAAEKRPPSRLQAFAGSERDGGDDNDENNADSEAAACGQVDVAAGYSEVTEHGGAGAESDEDDDADEEDEDEGDDEGEEEEDSQKSFFASEQSIVIGARTCASAKLIQCWPSLQRASVKSAPEMKIQTSTVKPLQITQTTGSRAHPLLRASLPGRHPIVQPAEPCRHRPAMQACSRLASPCRGSTCPQQQCSALDCRPAPRAAGGRHR